MALCACPDSSQYIDKTEVMGTERAYIGTCHVFLGIGGLYRIIDRTNEGERFAFEPTPACQTLVPFQISTVARTFLATDRAFPACGERFIASKSVTPTSVAIHDHDGG
jgi:hypothetical protein